MRRVKVEGGRAEDLLKRALFIAYNACGAPGGMGVLQAMRLNGEAPSEERVWKCIVGREDYGGFQASKTRIYADYVFGRMMKIGAEIVSEDVLEFGHDLDGHLRPDYQGFARRFPTIRKLIEQAAEELSVKWEEMIPKPGRCE